MAGEDFDALSHVRADAEALDALAAGGPASDDPALTLLGDLRAVVDALAVVTDGPAVRRDAFLLDALALGAPPSAATDPAIALLGALRATVDAAAVGPVALPPAAAYPAQPAAHAPAVVGIPETLAPAVVAGTVVAATDAAAAGGAAAPAAGDDLVERRARRRRHAVRTAAGVASLGIALSMSGVAAAAYSSHPGGTFYGIRTATWGRTDDDPVYAQDLLQQALQELQAAQANPNSQSAAADIASSQQKYAKARQIIPLEHDPAAQRSVQASASKVAVAIAAAPTPAATRSGDQAGKQPGSHTTSAASADATVHASGTPLPLLPEPSVGAGASVSPSASLSPSGSPSTTATPSGTPSDSPSGSVSPSGSATPTTSESPSDSHSPSATPSVTASSDRPTSPTTSRPSSSTSATATRPTRKPVKKTKKKHPTTATLMTATLSPTTPR